MSSTTSIRDERAVPFFNNVVADFAPGSAGSLFSIGVAHAVDSARYYVPALNDLAPIRVLIPKPGSQVSSVMDELRGRSFGILAVDRTELTAHAERLKPWLEGGDPSARVVLVDIGGYFAPILESLHHDYGDRIIGVVEDTENGIQQYEALYKRLEAPLYPVVSVARSPLKNPEDHLVGVAVVFSVEACLRRHAGIAQGRTACVVGYGKVGRGAAHALRDRCVATCVFETDPVRAIEAQSHGFVVPDTLASAVQDATIVISATGSKAFDRDSLTHLADGAFLASVTSADSEFADSARAVFDGGRHLDGGVTLCTSARGEFYVLNRGNAVNFLDGGALGPFIYLVQSEIIAGVARLSAGLIPKGISELSSDDRQALAGIWRTHFTH